jgi:hypothetical protein
VASDSLTVSIDDHGRIVPEGPTAARRLATRPGHYRLLPSPDRIVILERVDSDAGSGRTVLAGELGPRPEARGGSPPVIDHAAGLHTAMLDVIQFVHQNRWSGQLTALDGNVRRTLQLQRGELCGASSNQPEDRIGAVLYRAGRITAEDLERVLASRPVGTLRFGQRLVEAGALTAHDLYQYAHRQVEEIFHAVLVMRRGEYYFHRTTDEVAPGPLRLSTHELLLDGVRRIDEMASFREKIPGPDVIMVRRSPPPDGKLAPADARLLALVDGVRDVGVLARDSQLGEYETTRLLFQLLAGGWVQLAPRHAPPSVVQPPESLGLLVTVCNEGYARIHRVVAAHGRQEALFHWLDSFFGSAAEFAPLFVGATIDAEGRIGVEQLLANLEMAPVDDKLAYLQRGLRELLSFQLFAAGDIVDREQEQALREELGPLMRDLPER